MRYLAIELIFNESLPLLANSADPMATNPVWADLSHMSNNRSVVQVNLSLALSHARLWFSLFRLLSPTRPLSDCSPHQ